MHIPTPTRKAFTLVEVMVSTAIIGLIMLVLVAMTNQTSATWRSTTEKIEKFQEARDGFESMTRRLAQATLNTNWDYLDATGAPRPTTVNTTNYNSFIPVMYGRTSSLRLISGPMYTSKGNPLTTDKIRPTHGIFFQAPFGVVDLSNGQYATLPTDRNILASVLNTWGYYVEAGLDQTVPGFVSQVVLSNGQKAVMPRWRSRLMEFRQPSESMNLYEPASNSSSAWYTVPLKNAYANPQDPSVRVLAENIVALVLVPKLSKSDEDNLKAASNPYQLCPYYVYDSTMTTNPGMSAPTTGVNTASINPKNQLPPIIEVTMVAIDERSAKRLDEKYGTGPTGGSTGSPYMGLDLAGNKIGVTFTNLFTDQSTGPGTNGTGTPLEGPLGNATTVTPSDLNSLQQILIAEKVTYRIFTSNVTIRGAKWSRVQTK